MTHLNDKAPIKENSFIGDFMMIIIFKNSVDINREREIWHRSDTTKMKLINK